jgi:hypothetical protein
MVTSITVPLPRGLLTAVIRLTSELTSAWQMEGVYRRIRDVVVGLLSHVGAARRAMANAFEEVHINYQGRSPSAHGPEAPKWPPANTFPMSAMRRCPSN